MRAPLPLWAELVVGSVLILAIGYVAALLTSTGQILLAGGVSATALGLLASLFEPADSGGRIARPVGLVLGILGLLLVAVEAWSADATSAEILWGSVAEWATAIAAAIALFLSVVAVIVTRRTEAERLFVQIHDILTSPDAQRGRRIVHTRLATAEDITHLYESEPDVFDHVNRTLGLWNTLGIYAHRRILPRSLALDHWAGRVSGGWPRFETFLRWRRAQSDDAHMWSYLVWLAQESGAPVSSDLRLQPGWDRRFPRGRRRIAGSEDAAQPVPERVVGRGPGLGA